MDRIFAWCQRAAHRLAVRSGLHAHGAGALPRRARSGGLSRSRAALSALLRSAGRTRLDRSHEAGRAYITAASRAVRSGLARAGGRADRRRVFRRHGQHGGAAAGAARVRGARPPSGSASARSRSTSAAAKMRRRPSVSCAQLGLEASWERVERQPETLTISRRRFASSRTTIRSTSSVRPRRCACCAAFASGIQRLTLSARRRRRRREPEVVSARGFRPDAVEHPAQPAALSGGLGRRCHQAQPGVLGRAVARLRAHVRAGRGARVSTRSRRTRPDR